MESASTSHKEHDKPRRRWEWLLLLLALLMSFGCVFCASQLALSFWPNQLTSANMLARDQADYAGESGGFQFSALDAAVVAQAATDSARLHITPISASGSSPVKTSLLPPTPTPTATSRPQPTLADTPTVIPTPTASSTSTPVIAETTDTSTSGPTPAPPPGGNTSTPQPTSTSPPPTATLLPTNTLQPTATVPPTSTLPPTATLPPPPTSTSTPLPPLPPPPPPPPPPTNSPPVAGDDIAITDEDISTGPIQVLLNDSDSDGTLVPGSVTVVSGPTFGIITSINPATGDITYMPNSQLSGIDTFDYQVCDNDGACDTATVTVTVNPVNDPPVAIPDTDTVVEDFSQTIFVPANDIDVDGDQLTIISAGPALSGTLTINPTLPVNSITYMPNPNINGTDVFTYTISDGVLTDTTTVTVTILPTNDTPVANPDSYTTPPGVTLNIAASGVLTNDTDADIGDTLTVCFQPILCAGGPTSPSNGTLTMNPDGSFSYVPNPAFVGTDTFTYQVEDAIMTPSNITTVTITVS